MNILVYLFNCKILIVLNGLTAQRINKKRNELFLFQVYHMHLFEVTEKQSFCLYRSLKLHFKTDAYLYISTAASKVPLQKISQAQAQIIP